MLENAYSFPRRQGVRTSPRYSSKHFDVSSIIIGRGRKWPPSNMICFFAGEPSEMPAPVSDPDPSSRAIPMALAIPKSRDARRARPIYFGTFTSIPYFFSVGTIAFAFANTAFACAMAAGSASFASA